MVIVTGLGPQLNVMTPPAATAATTAADVQLAAVPSPITWSGWLVATAWAAAGTAACPSGLPAAASAAPATAPGDCAAVLPDACEGVLVTRVTAEATATGAPGADTVAAAPGAALDDAP